MNDTFRHKLCMRYLPENKILYEEDLYEKNMV
jgi:hypothetical protein